MSGLLDEFRTSQDWDTVVTGVTDTLVEDDEARTLGPQSHWNSFVVCGAFDRLLQFTILFVSDTVLTLARTVNPFSWFKVFYVSWFSLRLSFLYESFCILVHCLFQRNICSTCCFLNFVINFNLGKLFLL